MGVDVRAARSRAVADEATGSGKTGAGLSAP
jgi:hypothetical protein